MNNILTDVLIGILFFLLYIGVRAGARNHLIAGVLIGILFIVAGLSIPGTDGTILIISGLLVVLITAISKEKTEDE